MDTAYKFDCTFASIDYTYAKISSKKNTVIR